MSSVKDTKNEVLFNFSLIYPILEKKLNLKTQEEFAKKLGIRPSAVTNAKAKGIIPPKWISSLALQKLISWEEFTELMRQGVSSPVEKPVVEPVPVAPVIPIAAADRRRYDKLRGMIRIMSRSRALCEGLPELIELGLPNITRMIIREAHKDKRFSVVIKPDMNSPLDNL
jgi:hypothetical protein